jgi:hypothetical protein
LPRFANVYGNSLAIATTRNLPQGTAGPFPLTTHRYARQGISVYAGLTRFAPRLSVAV